MKYIILVAIIIIAALLFINKDQIMSMADGNYAAIIGGEEVIVTNDKRPTLITNVSPDLNSGTIKGVNSTEKKFKLGATVTLTAIPKPGYYFEGWTGPCEHIKNKCVFVMTEDKYATAYFKPFVKLPDGKCTFEEIDKDEMVEKIWADNTLTPEQKSDKVAQLNLPLFSCSKFFKW